MLQARCLSTPVYGRSHFKKFWLRKLEKEEELIEALDMSSFSVVSQQPHQQIMSASLNSCDNLKLSDQSPVYSSIPTTGIVRRTPSVANAVKFGSIAPTHVTGSTSGSEISNESLATRMTSFDVVQTSSVDEEAARISLKTVDAEYCAMSRLDENDYHKDCSTIDYTLSLGADKRNGGKIPPRLSRSGSPVLATSGPNQSSKILLQSPGFSSHGNLSSSVGDGDELGKQGLETDLSTVIYCKSVHLVPSIHDQLQETWKDSFPSTVDETVVQVRENAQLCSAFQSEENSLMRLPVMSTSNQGHVFTACASTSFRSAVTGLHHKMDSVGTDGCTEKILEHRLSLPVLDSAGMWRISGSNPRESSEQNQDASTKLLCSESWNACSPSKESDYNDKSKKTSGCRSKTNLYSRHLSSMNEFPYSLPSPKSRQQLPEGGSTRNLTRTCSHCGTMKTPLWRSGPSGPKSLCNACGIRLKKAGRRIATRESTDNSVSPPASPKSATKLTSRPLKRKLDKPNSYLVDSRFARARLKASQNHSPKLHLSKKTKIFSAQLRKVQAGEVYCEKAGSINRKTYFSSPSTSPRRTSSACTHETPDTYGVMPAAAFEARRHAIAMAMREVERLETTNPTSLRRSFAKDEEEGAVLLMALSYGLVNA